MAFDPDAATQAYMTMLTPAQHAMATSYTRGEEWLQLWGWLASLLVSWLILRSGLLAKLRLHIRSQNLAVAVCVSVFVGLSRLIGLPWSVYSDWWRKSSYGLARQPFMGWLGDALAMTIVAMIICALLAIAVYALMRRTPRHWWLWSGGIAMTGLIFVLQLLPVYILPMFSPDTQVPQGPTRAAIVALAKQAGVPSDNIVIDKQSERYTAQMVGGLFGMPSRIEMSEAMFRRGTDLSEVRALVAHEIGHYKMKHALWSLLFLAGMAIFGLFLIDRLFPSLRNWLGASDVADISDPVGLPIVMMIVATLGLLLLPVLNTCKRGLESSADRFSLKVANEPDGLARVLVKTIEYRASSPGAVEEILFYDHPSVEHRVHQAMVWKAEHPAGNARADQQ